MIDRRKFLTLTSMATAAATASLALPITKPEEKINSTMDNNLNTAKRFRPNNKSGMGGVAVGNGFQVNSDAECQQALTAAWDSGVRYFDTSPWYGLGLSERRFGHFLHNQQRDSFTLSTKVGRILTADDTFKMDKGIWKGKLNFNYRYDYTADGVRRSVEDSLQRLGLPYIDIVYIHDLSPDNGDMKENWLKYFDIAAKGAMPELTKMREEGLIKAWGLGVNTIEPALKSIQVADPDIFLSATQYSIIKHEEALNKLFPACEARGISIVVGAPLNAGFLAGVDRYDYSGTFPAGVKDKLKKLSNIAIKHQVDLRSASLQFCAAPDVVSSVIPGSHTAKQASENAGSFKVKIPQAFWQELKQEKLIEPNAPVPS